MKKVNVDHLWEDYLDMILKERSGWKSKKPIEEIMKW